MKDKQKWELLKAIEIIQEKYPLKHNHTEDARYTYPDRWNALIKYITEDLIKEVKEEK